MSQLLAGADLSATHALGSALTLVFFATFVGWIAWAYAPANAARHEAAGHLPFEGDSPLASNPAGDGGTR